MRELRLKEGNMVERAHASTQVDLPELWPTLKAWSEAHLKPEMLDPTNGIETDPHVTVLFGLLSENLAPLRDVGQKFGKAITLTLDALDVFENEDRDVLYVSVNSRDLHKLRKLLSGLPNSEERPTYIPHLTIAYLQKGAGAQFKGQKPFKAVFSKPGFILNKRNYTKEFIPTVSGKSFLLGEVPQRKPLSDSVDKSNEKEYN